MSVEDRLLVLLNQARQTGGDAALRDAAGLRSRLSSQAPDLHGEIQAMAAALAMGAPVRIAGAADAGAERAAIAADIARQERLSMSVVEPGLAVACQGGAGIGPADASGTPPTGGDDWAGDSIVVGAVDAPAARKPGEDAWAGDSIAVGAPGPAPVPPSLDKGAYPPPVASPPPYTPPQPGPYHPPQGGYGPGPYAPNADPYGAAASRPFYAQTWFFALIAAIIISAAVGYTVWRNWGGTTNAATTAQPTPNSAPVPPGPQPPVTPQPTSTAPRPGGPTLTAVDGPSVRLSQQTLADGRIGIGFRVVAQSGPIDGMIILPRGGWEGETTVLASNGAGAQSIGTGRLILQQGENNTPVRGMQVQWRQDGVGAGATELAFASAPGTADVVLAGAGMCIGDPQSGETIGCGQIE